MKGFIQMKTANNLRPFSLVELLVVVAVIAILAGLLLPALNSARQTAQQIKCTGSMKQIGTAAHLYAGQNDDWNMPSAFNASGNGSTAAGGTRFTTNREFLELLHIKANLYGYWDRGFVCSSVPESADPNFQDYKLATNAYGIAYRGGTVYPEMNGFSSSSEATIFSRKKVLTPSRKILILETSRGGIANEARRDPAAANAWWATHDNASASHNAYRHKNDTALNVLWFDGHVSLVTYKTMILNTMIDAYYPYR